MRILTVLTFLLLYKSTFGSHVASNLTESDEKLLKLICNIINNIASSTKDTQDILIGNMNGKWSQTMNDVASCINKGSSVVVTNLTNVMNEKRLRKASVIVMALDKADKDMIEDIIINHAYSTIWHHMSKVIIIIPSTATTKVRDFILKLFIKYGFFNVVTVRENQQGNIEVSLVPTLSRIVESKVNLEDGSKIFPDKLKDMKRYIYNIPVYVQAPLVKFKNMSIYTPMLHFLDAVCKKQNARQMLHLLPDPTQFVDMWNQRNMDLSVNTAVILNNPEPKLMNYEKRAFCALIPIPPKVSSFRFLVIMPFDYLIWVPLVLSIAGSFAVWWLYRGRGAIDSQWLLLAEIYKLFFGQGFTLSRNNHFMLLTLMQLICWLIFIISNAYESEITSCMIEPIHENRLKTVEDLKSSDYEIMSDEGFDYSINEYEGFEELRLMITRTDLHLPGQFWKEVIKQHFVFTTDCDVLKNDLKFRLRNGRLVSDYYYLLPEVILWNYVRLEASFLNPFMERFQFYMDLSFQAGLPHIWKVFENQDYSRYPVPNESQIMDSLRYEDLYAVFIVIGIGLLMSGIVFLIEIFYHDCLRYLDVKTMIGRTWSCLSKLCVQPKHAKLTVRKIDVKPARAH